MGILIEEDTLIVLLGLSLLAGVLALVLTRIGRPCKEQYAWQWVYFVMLAVVGGLTALTVNVANEYWLWCSSTLGVMIVGGTVTMQPRLPHEH
ncbi:MAG: hypothetical protein R3C28_17630 [Pirellulaceae bacterium]